MFVPPACPQLRPHSIACRRAMPGAEPELNGFARMVGNGAWRSTWEGAWMHGWNNPYA